MAFYLVCSLKPSFGQASKLDQKNGFNKFQLGNSFNSINEIAKLKQVDNDVPNSETYIVKDVNNYSLTGHPLQNILLTFYKNKLFRISLLMPPINASSNSIDMKQAASVRDRVIAEYGSLTGLDLSEDDVANNIVYKSVINGTNVGLYIVQYGLDRIDDQPYAKGDIFTFINKNLYKLMEKDLAQESGF